MYGGMKRSLFAAVCVMTASTLFYGSSVEACEVTQLATNLSLYEGHCWESVSVPICAGTCTTYEVGISSSIVVLLWRMTNATAVAVCSFLVICCRWDRFRPG